MKSSLERGLKKNIFRHDTQQKLTLLLARLTAQQGRLLFVPHSVLLQKLNIPPGGVSPANKIQQALQRLEKKGLVARSKSGSSWSARLTPQGETLARRLDISERVRIKRPKRWDGRWRIIIFDIWERRRSVRDKLRRALQKAGFYKIQDSVWAHPYDCEDLLVFLRADLRLGSGILYIVAEGVEGDMRLRRYFNLN